MPRPQKPRPQSAPPLRLVSLNTRSGLISRQEVRYEAQSKDDMANNASHHGMKARCSDYRPPRPRRTPPRPQTPASVDEYPGYPSRWANQRENTGEVSRAKTPEFKAGALSEGKMRDYGYGVPQWSPYYRPKGYKTPEMNQRPSSKDYGHFPPSQSLSPALQMRSARANIREMKGRATVDHIWETMGSRPACVDDLGWIEVAREQASLEAAYHEKMGRTVA